MQRMLTSPHIQAYLAYQGAANALDRRMQVSRHRRESGEVTSQMILVAVFAALAIAVGAVVWTKTTEKADAIPTDTEYTDTGAPAGS